MGVGIYIWAVLYSTALLLPKMNKYITCIVIATALLLTNAAPSYGQELVKEASASLNLKSNAQEADYRVLKLKDFLAKFNSPLKDYAWEFVFYADVNGLDWRLIPAITGVESTFGKKIPKNSYNAYGWANGNYKFTSWENSIAEVSITLRTKYIDRGAPTLSKIARRYAPPSQTWGTRVKYFIGKIDSLPVTFDI